MTSPNRITAKPTTYAGTRFRSRLEARWAAFFDLAGWKWEYEPIDLAGWQPDFYLRGERGVIPVEVKPIDWPEAKSASTLEAIVLGRADLQKVRDIVNVEVLILGSYLPTVETSLGGVPFGLLFERMINEQGETHSFVDVANLYAGQGRALDFSVEFGSWHLRMGSGAGKCDLTPVPAQEVEFLWRQAGNAVQWRGR